MVIDTETTFRRLKFYGLIVSVIVLVVSGYFIFVPKYERPSFRGWYVSVGDTLGYEIVGLDNSSLFTLLDEIYFEYHLNSTERNIFGTPIFTVKITYLPSSIDPKEIVGHVINFTLPIGVGRIIGNEIVEIETVKLPFAVPVGYWMDYIQLFNQCVPNLLSYNYEIVDLTDEITFNLTFMKNKVYYSFLITWDLNKGTLEAMKIRIGNNASWDYLHIALAKLSLQRDCSASRLLGIFLSEGIIISFIASLVFMIALIFSYLKDKAKQDYKIGGREIEEFSVSEFTRKQEMLRTKKAITGVLVVVNYGLGLLMFPILSALNAKTFALSFAVIIMFIIVPLISSFYLDYYEKAQLGNNFGATFLSYIVGISNWLILIIIQSDFATSPIFIGLSIALAFLVLIILYIIAKTYFLSHDSSHETKKSQN